MEISVCGWPAHRLGPSGLFEQIALETIEIIAGMDARLSELSRSSGHAGRRFRLWLKSLHEQATAVIFHGGEAVSEGSGPLTAIIVPCERECSQIIMNARLKACEGLLDAGVAGTKEMMALAIARKGLALRPFLSSELIVFASTGDISSLEGSFRVLRKVFEDNALEDLAALLLMDIRKDLFPASGDGAAGARIVMEETDFTGKKPVKRKVVDEADFTRLATRAMEKRRVRPELRGAVLGELKRSAGRACWPS